MWRGLPFSEAEFAKELGLKGLYGEGGYSALERKWARPTLEVNGLTSGYQGTGSKTVLPNRASAKITCRLVPGMDGKKIGDALIEYLKKLTPGEVEFELVYRLKESPAAITPIDSAAMGNCGGGDGDRIRKEAGVSSGWRQHSSGGMVQGGIGSGYGIDGVRVAG